MEILHTDSVFKIEPGTSANYNKGNSLLALMRLIERTDFACDREWYLRDSIQYLFPFEFLELYGPQGDSWAVTDPTAQNNKTDFQKQNIKSFITSATALTRGWVTTGDWTGPFLRLSYEAGPDSPLWKLNRGSLGASIKLWLRVSGRTVQTPLVVPYDEKSHRYAIELWGFAGTDLRSHLGGSSLDALDRGELQARSDLVSGDPIDFLRDKLNDRDVRGISSDSAMHPTNPLHIECAWANEAGNVWDSNEGKNYHYEFNMIFRGWDNFLQTGVSQNPHGGQGFLEYRNLLSNYGKFAGSGELGRELLPWNFNAFGTKNPTPAPEDFLSVDYMDLHILQPECGIGLHRHRDNQEVFFMMEGRGFMVVGDWCKMAQRERCFEIRTLRSGHFALLKGGNLHGLMNATDEDIALLMFGGYD
jgi:mannose-6-phosphate isomerase-like protein (cupin superfamily)